MLLTVLLLAFLLSSTSGNSTPQYSYSYSVNDPFTGDSKGQEETRIGDVVRGSYSLVEPDGTIRTVQYTADPINGFNAVVYKEPAAVGPLPVTSYAAPSVTPQYAAPPVTAQYATPSVTAQYAAPSVTAQYAAPSVTAQYTAPSVTAQYAAPSVTAQYAAPPVTAPVNVASPAVVTSALEYNAAAAIANPIFRSAPTKSFWMSFSTPDFSYSI